MEFADSWLWLIFIGAGLLLIILELAGMEASYDLVFIGSSLVLGGLITWPFYSLLVTVIVTCAICVAYVFIGRKYVHTKWAAVAKTKTNIDAIVGKKGIVLQSISRHVDGLVKIGNEKWKARSEEEINEGDEIIVGSVSGVTLVVNKTEGGN